MRFTVKLLSVFISVAAIFALLETSFAAQSEPIDLRPISAPLVKQHVAELAAVVEKYSPYLKTPAAHAKFAAKAQRLEDSVHGSIPTWQAWLLQQKLLRTLDHPHLAVGPNPIEDRALAVDFHWVSDGLLISPASWMNPPLFPKNSRVLRIDDESPMQLLPKLEALYSGMPGWIKIQAYTLRYAYALRWFDLLGAHDQVAVTLRTPKGEMRQLILALAPTPTGATLKKALVAAHPHGWFHWSIDTRHNIGWFTLDSMKLTGPYEQSVVMFFRAVERAGITRVAVDLRKNGGGSSIAEAPFMQYLGVTKIQDYSTQIYFDPMHLRQELAQLTQYFGYTTAFKRLYPKGFIPVPPAPTPSQIFHGHLYVITGPGTFSSAMDFAADAQFNHVGTIVGMPCAETLTSPGDVKFFPHPSSGIPFQVPTDIYAWPGMPSNAFVKPDVKIPLTVSDVQKGIDPVRRWFDASAGAHSTG